MGWLDDLVAVAHENLGDSEREALWARGVSDQQIDLFRIGCLKQLPESVEVPKDFWGATKGGQRLDDVFVLPLTNILGHIRGLQFRHVSRELSGYLTYYEAKDEPVYFGLGQAMQKIWETSTVWVVEGGFDLFPIQRVFSNVFAALTIGTSESLARMLRRLVSSVWLCYDNDKSGSSASEYFTRAYGAYFDEVNVVKIPKVKTGETYTKDPSELWEAWGDTKLRSFLESQMNPLCGEREHA